QPSEQTAVAARLKSRVSGIARVRGTWLVHDWPRPTRFPCCGTTPRGGLVSDQIPTIPVGRYHFKAADPAPGYRQFITTEPLDLALRILRDGSWGFILGKDATYEESRLIARLLRKRVSKVGYCPPEIRFPQRGPIEQYQRMPCTFAFALA